MIRLTGNVLKLSLRMEAGAYFPESQALGWSPNASAVADEDCRDDGSKDDIYRYRCPKCPFVNKKKSVQDHLSANHFTG